MADQNEESSLDRADEFLAHYGVRGMKWGQRRKRAKAIRKGVRTRQKNFEAKRKVDTKQAAADKKSGKTLTKKQKELLQLRNSKRISAVTNTAIAGGLTAYYGKRYGPMAMEVLRIAAVKTAKSRQARQGAKAAAQTLRAIGANKTASLSLVDGVWKLVN